MTTGERIRSAREQKGLTLEELGKLIGVQKSAIFKYESNIVTNIPTKRLGQIAKALDVNAGYLMGWSENPVPEMSPTEEEIAIIKAYRAAPPEVRTVIDKILRD